MREFISEKNLSVYLQSLSLYGGAVARAVMTVSRIMADQLPPAQTAQRKALEEEIVNCHMASESFGRITNAMATAYKAQAKRDNTPKLKAGAKKKASKGYR